MLYIPVALQCLSLLRQRACWGIPESTKTILLASTALRTGFVSGSVPESLKPMKSPKPSVGKNGSSALSGMVGWTAGHGPSASWAWPASRRIWTGTARRTQGGRLCHLVPQTDINDVETCAQNLVSCRSKADNRPVLATGDRPWNTKPAYRAWSFYWVRA